MKKVLFVAAHRKDRSPSQRFRFEQYFNYLESQGIECKLSYLINAQDDTIFYSTGNFFDKLLILIKIGFTRLVDIGHAKKYDAVFIQREAFFTGTTFFERRFKANCGKMIFDFDDAIWNKDVSSGNRFFGWLKNPKKTETIIEHCDLVIAGNDYLASYARKFSDNVQIIPTTIDTDEYVSSRKTDHSGKICIGWSGSITTIKHFQYALPFLIRIKKKYGDKVVIKVIGDETYRNKDLEIKGIAWNKEREIEDLSSFDIGIMPLPNDSWAKGKCGLKGLQYMALQIPTIMSPVGVNTEIIQDGTNGFLADTTDEWVKKISDLIDNSALRTRIGQAARKTVIEQYSVDSQKESYLKALNSVF